MIGNDDSNYVHAHESVQREVQGIPDIKVIYVTVLYLVTKI